MSTTSSMTKAEAAREWARYIQLLMELHKVNNAQLAEAIGVSRSTPGMWLKEGAVSIPDRDSIRGVAEFFGRPIAEVLTRAGYATEEELSYSAPPVDPRNLSKDMLLAILKERLTDAPDQASAQGEPDQPDAAPKTVKARRTATNRR